MTGSSHPAGGAERVLVVNTGSSSCKLRLLSATDGIVADERLDAPGGTFDTGALDRFLAGVASEVDAVGHRVVHGGERHRAAALVDGDVLDGLRRLVPLAPLHQKAALQAIELVAERLPGVPGVACFDTAFHASLPPAATTYAVPSRWREELGVRRYGFHGLSHAWAVTRVGTLLGVDHREQRVLSCHLGAGASLAAVVAGRCVDTTMGFTPLEGLVMATRSGTIDPGIITWLVREQRMDPAAVADALERRSGLLALAGTADMATVVARAEAGDRAADTALDVYAHRFRSLAAGMVAAMGGVDAVVFTGGVGEHAPSVRSRAAAGLGFLGVALDGAANRAACGVDAEITAPGAAVRAAVVVSREDLQIAGEVRALLRDLGSATSGAGDR